MNLLLISIGLILVIFGFAGIKKDSLQEKSKSKFQDNLKTALDNSDDYKVEIAKLRREFSETLVDIQKEIYDVKMGKDYFVKSEKKVTPKEGKKEENSEKEYNRPNSVEIIKKMMNEGASIEEICAETDMKKGEVLLVKELYL